MIATAFADAWHRYLPSAEKDVTDDTNVTEQVSATRDVTSATSVTSSAGEGTQ